MVEVNGKLLPYRAWNPGYPHSRTPAMLIFLCLCVHCRGTNSASCMSSEHSPWLTASTELNILFSAKT